MARTVRDVYKRQMHQDAAPPDSVEVFCYSQHLRGLIRTRVQQLVSECIEFNTLMGKKTMELHHVSKSYGEKVLVRDFSYTVLKNQKLGIIGPNGCGKSTLIKMMAGLVQPDSEIGRAHV